MTSFASHKIPTTCTTQSCSTAQTHKNGDRILFKLESSTPQKEPRPERVRPERVRRELVSFDDLPFCMEDVTALLWQHGDSVSKPYDAARLIGEDDRYKILFNQNKRKRTCLYDHRRVHESNNINLTLARMGQLFHVEYHCFGAECCLSLIHI